MPHFLHLPSQQIIEAHGTRAARYRRSSRFTELDPSIDRPTESPNSLPVSSSSPAEASNQPAAPPDQPPDSPQIHTIAPETPSDSFPDLPLTDIDNHTVSEILRWVGTDPDRAKAALQAETQGRNRVTLTSKLRRIR